MPVKSKRTLINIVMMIISAILVLLLIRVIFSISPVPLKIAVIALCLMHTAAWFLVELKNYYICYKEYFTKFEQEEEKHYKDMKKCSICEKYVEFDASICPNCGHDFNYKVKQVNQ